MPRDIEPSLNERQFFAKALSENIRLDGRAFDQWRNLEIEFGDEYGVVDVRLGNTRIQTHISATLTSPFPDRPFSAVFTITTELSPMTSPLHESLRPNTTELLLSRLLEKTIRRSQALDTESLCLIAGRVVWSVLATIHVLSHDGNLVDAACVAVIAALQHFRRPDTSIEGAEVTIYTAMERDPVPLSLLHTPLCVTVSFYGEGGGEGEAHGDGGEKMLLDATALEEQCRRGSCTVGMNKDGEVCQVAKLGGQPVDAVALLQVVNLAFVKVKQLSKFIETRLNEDKKKRDKGGLMAELSAENSRIS